MGKLFGMKPAEPLTEAERLFASIFQDHEHYVCSMFTKYLSQKDREGPCPVDEIKTNIEKHLGGVFKMAKKHFPGLEEPVSYIHAFWKYCSPECDKCEIYGKSAFRPKPREPIEQTMHS